LRPLLLSSSAWVMGSRGKEGSAEGAPLECLG
jgi:hypothetical protein